MRRSISPLNLLAAAGSVAAATAAANAQPQLINISGSTLLRNFITAPASTNDYLGVTGLPTVPPASLTPTTIQDPSSTTKVWFINFRGSGSVNGFNELINFGYPMFLTDTDLGTLVGNRPTGVPPANGKATEQWANTGTRFVNAGAATAAFPSYNMNNPGGQPYRAATNGADRSVVDFGYSGGGSPLGGVTFDIAYLDVPGWWGTAKTNPGFVPGYGHKPGDNGYGANPRVSVGRDGGASGGGFGNALPTLSTRDLAGDPTRDTGTNPYGPNTIFEIPLAMAVVAPVTNYGTGITQMKMSDMQWLWTTGRARSGENFVVATRSIDSGTRNAMMNCIGIDPSWGVGDNVGGESILGPENQMGSSFYPTNKGSTGQLRDTVKNHRLAIGYIGADGGVSDGWLTAANRQFDIIDTQNDIYPGATGDYTRPTLARVLSNDASDASVSGGWVINGQAVIATIGDSLAEPATLRTAVAGDNWGGDASGNPAMVNKAAAKYVNNIYRSILAFNSAPTVLEAQFSPGEFLASKNVLIAAVNNVTPVSDPLSRVPNTNSNNPRQPFSSFTNTYTTGLSNQVFKNTNYTSFSTTSTGLVPSRVTAANTYSDKSIPAVNDGAAYVQQSGSTLTYGSAMPARNKIAYDFDGNGSRTLADVNDLVGAWKQRWSSGNPVWSPSDANLNACIECLGDGNGDGSFDRADVRYWADGLALVSGKLNRAKGFKAVDDALGGYTVAADGSTSGFGGTANFFGTVLATGKAYSNGDSRADVYGPSKKVAPGWAPVGADGVIDANDIDYVQANIRAAGGSADWNVLGQAVRVDLSCDITGDLKVDQADVQAIFDILGACRGDVNLDGKYNIADRNIVLASIATPPSVVGFASGDVNGDGVINALDSQAVCPADFNCTGSVTVQGIFDFLAAWFGGSPKADFNNSASVSVQDIFDFLAAWFAGQCS